MKTGRESTLNWDSYLARTQMCTLKEDRCVLLVAKSINVLQFLLFWRYLLQIKFSKASTIFDRVVLEYYRKTSPGWACFRDVLLSANSRGGFLFKMNAANTEIGDYKTMTKTTAQIFQP